MIILYRCYFVVLFLTGAGGYADNAVGAVSSTGHGESISKVCLAHRIVCNVRQGGSLPNLYHFDLSFYVSLPKRNLLRWIGFNLSFRCILAKMYFSRPKFCGFGLEGSGLALGEGPA